MSEEATQSTAAEQPAAPSTANPASTPSPAGTAAEGKKPKAAPGEQPSPSSENKTQPSVAPTGVDQKSVSAQKEAIARALRRESHPDDHGQIAPELKAALQHNDFTDQLEHIVQVLPKIRLMMPIYPHVTAEDAQVLGEGGACPPGTLPETEFYPGYRATAVPVYSDLTNLSATHPGARPVPVNGRLLAMSVLQGPGRLLLNNYFVIPRPALNAVASGDQWLPAWSNPQFMGKVRELCAQIGGLQCMAMTPQPSGPDYLLVAMADHGPDGVRNLNRLQQGLLGIPGFAEATDGLIVMPYME